RDGNRLDIAEGYLKEALKIQGELLSGPEAGKNRWYRARFYSDLAMLLQESGKHAEAMEAYQEAIGLQKQLVKNNAKNPDFRFNLARTCNELGDLLRDSGKQEDARTQHQDAFDLFKALHEENPKDESYRRNLAVSHHRLGLLFKNDGR